LPSSHARPEASGSGVDASNGCGSHVHAAALPVAGAALPVAGAGGADFPHATSAKATQHLTPAL
jgi:hypothetical protein